VLKQCANFYNNIATQMIPSQKPMMLADAIEFEQVGSCLNALLQVWLSHMLKLHEATHASCLWLAFRGLLSPGSITMMQVHACPLPPSFLAPQTLLNPKDSQGRDITWQSVSGLDGYVRRLHAVAERLADKNRSLRACHAALSRRVLELMSTDLVLHKDRCSQQPPGPVLACAEWCSLNHHSSCQQPSQ
jgi:hypothetical protein